jgi:hypothetical protein
MGCESNQVSWKREGLSVGNLREGFGFSKSLVYGKRRRNIYVFHT